MEYTCRAIPARLQDQQRGANLPFTGQLLGEMAGKAFVRCQATLGGGPFSLGYWLPELYERLDQSLPPCYKLSFGIDEHAADAFEGDIGLILVWGDPSTVHDSTAAQVSSQLGLLTEPFRAMDASGGRQQIGSHVGKVSVRHKHPDAAWGRRGQPHTTVLEVAWLNESVERLIDETRVWARRSNAIGVKLWYAGGADRLAGRCSWLVVTLAHEQSELRVWRIGEEALAADLPVTPLTIVEMDGEVPTVPGAWLSRDKRHPAVPLALNVLGGWVLHQLRYEDEEAAGRRFTDDELQSVRGELEDWQAAHALLKSAHPHLLFALGKTRERIKLKADEVRELEDEARIAAWELQDGLVWRQDRSEWECQGASGEAYVFDEGTREWTRARKRKRSPSPETTSR